MAEKAMAVYSPQQLEVKNCRGNYQLSCGNMETILKRDTDFGLIPGTKKPTLYKAGAERITLLFGVTTEYKCETAWEDIEKGTFYFRFSCILKKDGYEIAGGVGACSSKERKYSTQSGFDVANTVLKMAKKRALVDAAIHIGKLSNLFDQDIENETFMSGAKTITEAKDTDKITTKQARRIFAIGSNYGLTTEDVKNILAQNGYDSTKEIVQADYEKICDAFESYGRGEIKNVSDK